MKVLFIDDDLVTTEWVEIFLKSQGIETRAAHSLSDAIEILRNWPPNVILSDLSLKDHNAFSLLDYLANSRRSKHVPVIAITGHALSVSERERFDGYLRKPVDVEELLKLVQSFSGNG